MYVFSIYTQTSSLYVLLCVGFLNIQVNYIFFWNLDHLVTENYSTQPYLILHASTSLIVCKYSTLFLFISLPQICLKAKNKHYICNLFFKCELVSLDSALFWFDIIFISSCIAKFDKANKEMKRLHQAGFAASDIAIMYIRLTTDAPCINNSNNTVLLLS